MLMTQRSTAIPQNHSSTCGQHKQIGSTVNKVGLSSREIKDILLVHLEPKCPQVLKMREDEEEEEEERSRCGDDPDPKVCPQLLQKDESEHSLRDQADCSRNETLRRRVKG